MNVRRGEKMQVRKENDTYVMDVKDANGLWGAITLDSWVCVNAWPKRRLEDLAGLHMVVRR